MNNHLSLIRYALTITLCASIFFACEEPEEAAVPPSPSTESGIAEATLNQLTGLGFDVSDIQKQGDNFLVEGDIILTPEAIEQMLSSEPTIVNNPTGEQYRTFNLVSRNLRTIRIRPTSNNSRFLLAIDRAIFNYNQLGLTFNMVRVGSNSAAEITVRPVAGGGGRAGFPTGNGFPFNDVQIGVDVFNNNDDDVTEFVVTHEIGHCLGLRHSDWYNRSLSCGSGGNEGSAGIGAEFIPGTVVNDPNSVMKSCFSSNETGEFTQFDAVALRELY